MPMVKKSGKFFIGYKKTYDSLLPIKNQLSIDHWIEISFLIDHPIVKVGEKYHFYS
jgi:hypothetical protein